jgi:hypothetical protein
MGEGISPGAIVPSIRPMLYREGIEYVERAGDVNQEVSKQCSPRLLFVTYQH